MAALIVFQFLYTLRIGETNSKSIDDFRLIFGKTMKKGVLARLERIFECVDAQEDISTDVNLLKLHCVDIVKSETCGKHLEKNVENAVRVCEFSRLQFPKHYLERCGNQYIPVR